MAKKLIKMKPTSTNVRYIKARQRGAHLLQGGKKMKDIQLIIEKYRNADFETRQYLFLSHRSLRNEFLEIEQQDAVEQLSAAPVKNRCCMGGFWGQSWMGA